MSIFGALTSSVSGLAAQSSALGVISDNITNVNTVGFKENRASFSTLVTAGATETSFSPGGVQFRPLQQISQQGLLQASDSKTDLAISGNGFFVVNETSTAGVGDDVLFTRAGQFRADKNGDFVNAAGYFLQGWPLDTSGNLPAAQQSISSLETVNTTGLTGLPQATGSIEVAANVPSGASNGQTHSVTVQVFDALGTPYNMKIDFAFNNNGSAGNPADDFWDVTLNAPTLASDPTQQAQIGGGASVAGELRFNGDGSPASLSNFPGAVTVNGGTLSFDITSFPTGASDSTGVQLDLATIGDFNGMTQFAGGFEIGNINQDGLRRGNFSGVSVDEQGVMTALFDNGRTKDIYKLPVATFNNPDGLEAVDGNAYLRSDKSGPFLLNEANQGPAGKIAPSALEGSTVDLANEFTKMIVTQRAYSAATRVVTTSDEMLQELTQATR